MAKATPAVDLAAHRIVLAFMETFRCNERSILQYDPLSGRVWSELKPVTPQHWVDHLKGKTGLGGSPIMDDHMCYWAGIDLDNHDNPSEDLPIAKIWADIQAHKLPLIPCRTKSGGVHCYAFFGDPQPAPRVRHVLAGWARRLGFPKAEVFPKQSVLQKSSNGGRQLGMGMNWPYFGGSDTNRYAFHEGEKLSIDQFLALAGSMKITTARMKLAMIEGHAQAPPCLQKLMADGVAPGMRNEAMYNFAVYLRKSAPGTALEDAKDINFNVFAKPLPSGEFTRTLNSGMREECQYRCGEEPIKSLCNRDLCQTLKFGISKDESDVLSTIQDLPVFTNLMKYLSEPVRWEMKIDGRLVTNISTPMLLDWRAMREIIADKLTRVVPLIKPQEWERVLQPLMKEARIIEAPDDASIAGVIRERLREFASKTDLTNRGENTEDRRALLRGLPCVQLYEGERMIMFRAQDFVNYLKRQKSEELKGINLWFAVKELGVGHTKLRVGSDSNINMWYMPVKEILADLITPTGPEYKSEL